MDNRRNEPNLKLINMEQVEIEKIGWLLYPFIPFGKVTIVQGDPGEGKTTMVLQIIAKLTKGEAVLPSGSDEPALEEKTMDLEFIRLQRMDWEIPLSLDFFPQVQTVPE